MKNLLKVCCFVIFIAAVLFFVSDLPSFSKTIKFAQLSDIHYALGREDKGYKLLSQTQPLLEDAIKQINDEKGIDFVMITGDGIDRAKKDDLYSLTDELNTLNYPWYYVLGNHDTTANGYLSKTNFLKILNEKNPNYKFNVPYYTFKPKKGFRIIVLDGTISGPSVKKNTPNGTLSNEELSWLDNVLSESKKEAVIIFMHFPIFPPYESKHLELLNADKLKAVLQKHDMPIALFTGHYHTTKITQKNNILQVITPALVSYPNAFRIVEVTKKNNQITYKINYIETNLKDLQEKTKGRGIKHYGSKKDRDAIITLEKKHN
ncbi:MAG: metallophosphoesterase [Candidatus Gastranaerophilales bacterium]|nr:metallophosphoesterase [Candidatus Gastranaerophilales bacterium]